jgi:hypothetical protein
LLDSFHILIKEKETFAMSKLNKQSLKTSDLFAEVMPKEAVTVTGGNIQRFITRNALAIFGLGYVPVLRQQQGILGRQLLGILRSGGGNTGIVNHLLTQAHRLSRF